MAHFTVSQHKAPKKDDETFITLSFLFEEKKLTKYERT